MKYLRVNNFFRVCFCQRFCKTQTPTHRFFYHSLAGDSFLSIDLKNDISFAGDSTSTIDLKLFCPLFAGDRLLSIDLPYVTRIAIDFLSFSRRRWLPIESSKNEHFINYFTFFLKNIQKNLHMFFL